MFVASIERPILSFALKLAMVLPTKSVSILAVRFLLIVVLLIGVVFWFSVMVTSVVVFVLPEK
ncbi:hypothetical protein EGR52_00535 [bacterium]|nr:hypothetical protein [bacterium]MBD8921918.1 hypothetical protein [bacterium]